MTKQLYSADIIGAQAILTVPAGVVKLFTNVLVVNRRQQQHAGFLASTKLQ